MKCILLASGILAASCAGPVAAPTAVIAHEDPGVPPIAAAVEASAEPDLDAGVAIAASPRPRRRRAPPTASAPAPRCLRRERRSFTIADASIEVEGCVDDPADAGASGPP